MSTHGETAIGRLRGLGSRGARSGGVRPPLVEGRGGAPVAVSLDDPVALDHRLVGVKAANLARARAAGLPVLGGTVLTTVGSSRVFASGEIDPVVKDRLHRTWTELGGMEHAIIVRSSSTIEDADTSSMAGQFTTVLDVLGWDPFLDAVRQVLDSASAPELSDAPMAVLVQPHLRAATAGVLFGADPVTRDASHLVVASVAGGAEALVGGGVDGATTVLDRRGRPRGGAPLDRRIRRRLARLARTTELLFGRPQDIEWAVDHDGRLWLLQARPITTPVGWPRGPRLGPGPVAETFPDALTPLERDLWVEPLRRGVLEALQLTGAASPSQLRRSPVVIAVDGRVAVDLDLFSGSGSAARGLARVLDPRPRLRRLQAAWRVGRLRTSVAGLGRDVVGDVDDALLGVGPLDELPDHRLVDLVRTSRDALVALHGHEVLAGLLLPTQDADGGPSGAATALRALVEGRAAGHDDADITRRDPVVLALVPPAIAPSRPLPAAGGAGGGPPATGAAAPVTGGGAAIAAPPTTTGGDPFESMALVREALRVRARWVHELTARACWLLGRRWQRTGRLADAELVRWLSLDELAAVAAGEPAPAEVAARPVPSPPPLPSVFRMSTDGHVVTERTPAAEASGAGGGRGTGLVHHGPQPPAGSVLVVRTLDPGLAALLPELGGLVAETGSPLSHLAILAREYGIPTVVGLIDATTSFAPGERVVVDGGAGTVERAAVP